MRDETMAELEILIGQMPRGTAPEWGAATRKYYAAVLTDLSDAEIKAAVNYIARDVALSRFRPQPAVIIDIARRIFAPPSDTLPDVFARLRRLVARYGEYGAVHPAFPDAWPTICDLGPPPELAKMPPAAQKTVDALGGWVVFARSFDWASGTDRAQFRDLYNASSVSAKDSVLRAIRDDYRTRAAPKITGAEPVDGADTSAPSSAIGRSEASDIMSRVGQIVRPLYGE